MSSSVASYETLPAYNRLIATKNRETVTQKCHKKHKTKNLMPIFVDAYLALREQLDMWQMTESEHIHASN